MTDTAVIYDIIGRDRTAGAFGTAGSAFNKFALGLAAGAAFAGDKLVNMAADFQSSTNRLVTSAGETQAGLDTVRKGILNMAGQVGDSASELSQAMYTIESGGQHGADGLKVLQAAAEGAKAEGADLATVSDAITSVLQDYHLKATDAATVTSKMVAAVGSGKTTFEQFAGSLSSVLPIASSAHISFDDISAAIASMTVHGMSADQATQNLADTIRHMTAPTMVQTKELAQLGISSGDLAGMLGSKGLTGTLQTVSQAILTHMGPSGKVLLSAFNQSKDAAADANKMIQAMPPSLQKLAHQYQAGTISLGDWRKTLKTLPPEQANLLAQFASLQAQASGFSDTLKAGGPAAQTYQAALAKATGDATGLNTALMLTGENSAYVAGALKAVSGATAESGNHVKGWADVQATFSQRLAQTKDSLGALGIQIGNALLPKVQAIVTVIGDATSWLQKHQSAAKTAAITIGVLAGGFVAWRVAVTAANIASKTWLVLTNLGKAAMFAWNGVMFVARAGIVAWVAVSNLDILGWVRRAALVVANTAALVAYTVASNAVKVATMAWTAAQWLLNVALDANPIGLVVIGIAALVAGIVWVATKTTWFQSIWHVTWDFLKAVGAWFAGPFAHFFVAAFNDIKAVTSAYYGFWVSVWNKVVSFFTGMPGRISHVASGMWDGIKNAFRAAVDWIIDGWNRLHFTIPSVDFLGFHSPSFTLGVPHIPRLATGGIATRGGLAMVGERGAEVVSLPTGASVYPHGSAPAGRGVTISFANADGAFASAFKQLVRTGAITAIDSTGQRVKFA